MIGDGSRAHLPSPSYWPFVLALGLPFIGWGLIFNMFITAFGGALVLAGFVGWALEPADDPDLPPHGHDDHGTADDPTGDAAALAHPATEEEVTVGGSHTRPIQHHPPSEERSAGDESGRTVT